MTPVAAAADLRSARLTRIPRRPFTDTDATLDVRWGYQAQNADRVQRVAQGERIVGAKMGLTSAAKQATMGVHQPIAGFLTDAMRLPAGHNYDLLARTAQPRIEPEIAFRLGVVVDRPLTMASAADAIDGIAAAAEIIDSRYAAYGFRLPDVVADNTSAAAFVIGDWIDPAAAGDLAALRCVFAADSRVLASSTGAAILGHPLQALIHLSNHLSSHGGYLRPGAVVLAGAVTDAVTIAPGVTYRAEIENLGAVEFSTSPEQRTTT
ncbi:fumarylacetoacetate hydrolase family protein [Actinoplanes sp. NBRC 101535]|uniref:2-keto-4-pentenoate hydratase n=1 Tax=Actinoplanes sp. NBRC 101535 TaxID=3032196 RepID=UPI0024A5C7FD|nr:fumarylacetoacetate hydrolase family protein [Actinoplanes sp. NBRC 101535]GLY08775.1 4-oxalocrotonate decarboxylase [Actinoplanes sp. NBRC 101535]